MGPQMPVRRACEGNDAAIARWLRTRFPTIAMDAKRDKAVIYWGDDMGLRSDHVAGTSYAPMGQTPIIRAIGQRFGGDTISAITNRGHPAFIVFHGKLDGRLFVQFIRCLFQQATGKLYLIVDGRPVHRSVVARDFVAGNEAKLCRIRLADYCPEYKPDELLNQDVRTNGLGKSCPANRAELMAGVLSHLRRQQKRPQVIPNLFREKHVRYAA